MNRFKSRWWLYLLLAWVVFSIAYQSVTGIIRYHNDQVALAEAEQWVSQARQAAHPGLTKEDAIQWFKNNNSPDVQIGGVISRDGKLTNDYTILAFRPFRDRSIVQSCLSVMLTFRFDEHWQFQRVEAEHLPYWTGPR